MQNKNKNNTDNFKENPMNQTNITPIQAAISQLSGQ